jgi:hypothetical protein
LRCWQVAVAQCKGGRRPAGEREEERW